MPLAPEKFGFRFGLALGVVRVAAIRNVGLSVIFIWALGIAPATAGVIFNNSGLSGGSRWDAAPRTVAGVGERSLSGGLRYSLQGGSFQSYRNLFTWNSLPSVSDFQTAVEQAFGAWAAADPFTGFVSGVSFAADLSTAVSGVVGGGSNTQGAEIDLFGVADASSWNPGSNGLQGEAWFGGLGSTVTLTSGTANYANSFAIAGADVYMNSNSQAVWNLDTFRRVLTHELGHAIGLGDVESGLNPGRFIDDDFDSSSSATIVATLTNSWSSKVNPLNPAASTGLNVFTLSGGALTTSGVDILMESNGVGISPGNPVTNLFPLTADDYSTRYFLYPTLTAVPEPSSLAILAVGAAAAWAARRRSSKVSTAEDAEER